MAQDEGEFMLTFVSSNKFYLIQNGDTVSMTLVIGTAAEVNQSKTVIYCSSNLLELGVVIIIDLVTDVCF